MIFSTSVCRLKGHHHVTAGVDFSLSSFETLERADLLRYSLASAVVSIGDFCRSSKSIFGLVPQNSLLDKCPYYRDFSSSAEKAYMSNHLKWLLATRKKIEEALVKSEKEPKYVSHGSKKPENEGVTYMTMRKKYQRDRLTVPGMVFVYNVMLVWMMFNIEFRASSL